jgi:hypothetical protein
MESEINECNNSSGVVSNLASYILHPSVHYLEEIQLHDSQSHETLKYDHESRVARNQEWLCWRNHQQIYPTGGSVFKILMILLKLPNETLFRFCEVQAKVENAVRTCFKVLFWRGWEKPPEFFVKIISLGRIMNRHVATCATLLKAF